MLGKNKKTNKNESPFDSNDFKDRNQSFENNKVNSDISQIDENSNRQNDFANSSNVDRNEVFFEKFEKSKKDFIKEKRKERNKAKKSISNQNKLLGFENRLRDDSYFKRFWILLLSVTGLLLAYSCIVIAFLGPHFSSASDTSRWSPAVKLFGGLTKTSVIFTGIVIVSLPLPYLFLLTSWFIGINSVHRSKVFIIANLVVVSIAILLIAITIPLSSYVFNRVLSFLPVTTS